MADTIRDRFPMGCRVRLSPLGRRMVTSRAPLGSVVGWSRDWTALRVKRDGLSAAITTHPDHWERVPFERAFDAPHIEEHW